MKNRRGILAVIGSARAIFYPGAFIFGYPGVMGPLWQRQYGVGRDEIGNTLFYVLAAVGLFMFFVGRFLNFFPLDFYFLPFYTSSIKKQILITYLET